MVIMTVVVSGYIPTIKPMSELFKPFYPVNNKYALILNHTVDLFRPVYIYTFISLLSFSIYSIGFSFVNLMVTLLWMYAAILTDNLVKTTIYKNLPQPYIAIALLSTIIFTIMAYFVTGLTIYQPTFLLQYVLAIVVIFVSFMALFIWSASGLEGRSPNQAVVSVNTTLKSFNTMLINLYFRRKTTVVILAIVPIIKVLILVYLYLFYYRVETGLGVTELFYSYLLMTPALIFTYIHNNLAGFFREVWLSHDLCNGDPRKLAKTYIITLLPAWIYDFTLSVFALYIIGLFAWKYIIFYITLTVIIYFLGMYASIYHPRFIDRFLSLDRMAGLKNNTSGLMSFYCGLIMLSLAIFIEMNFMLWYIPVAAILIGIFFYKSGNYSILKYEMYAELFRQRK